MNEKFLELRKYLLSSTNDERNGKVSEMTEDQINDFYNIYHLTFEELGDKKYREGNYIEASLNYECAVKLLEMVQLFELLHDPYEEIIQSKWEELQDARLKLLLAEYHKAAVNWEKQETPDDFVTDVLKRGFWTCWGNNKDAEVLVTGINPSFDKKFPCEPLPTIAGNDEATEWYHFYPPFSQCRGRHWNPILKIVANQFRVNQPHEEKAAYLDLFPLRVTSQTDIDKIPIELRASLLRVTQKEIEYLRPRLIVHLNKDSWFYWGIKREHPWMGYDLEKIENYKEKGELFRICGMQNTDRKILPLTKTNLEGSLLLLYKSQTPRGILLPEEERLTEEDIREIFRKYHKP